MNNPNCGACGMLNSRGFCSLTACRFPVVNELGTWQERILANKPKHTNADRIRSYTDEELAEWFSIYCCRNKTYDAHCETFGSCKACWSSWLQEEAKE